MDYSALTSEELIALLNERDTKLATMTTADVVINTIHDLSEDARRELAEKVRTTDTGIEAFMIFNFGATESAPIEKEDAVKM